MAQSSGVQIGLLALTASLTNSFTAKLHELIARVLGLRDCRLVMRHSAIAFKLVSRSRWIWPSKLLKQRLALYKTSVNTSVNMVVGMLKWKGFFQGVLSFLRKALA